MSEEKEPFRCRCGSTIFEETFLHTDGLYTQRWELGKELIQPPLESFTDIKLVDVICGLCRHTLEGDEETAFLEATT